MAEDDIKSLVDQLKESTKLAKQVKKPEFQLDKSDLEQFILNNTGKLINDSMETIDNIKDFIISAPEPEDVHSLAELYKASTGAIEALNKILLQQQKSDTQIAVKTMDIQAKQAIAEKKDDKITFTRDEIFEQLLKSGEVIEADIVDVDDQESSG
jgi:hypothetical protein